MKQTCRHQNPTKAYNIGLFGASSTKKEAKNETEMKRFILARLTKVVPSIYNDHLVLNFYIFNLSIIYKSVLPPGSRFILMVNIGECYFFFFTQTIELLGIFSGILYCFLVFLFTRAFSRPNNL